MKKNVKSILAIVLALALCVMGMAGCAAGREETAAQIANGGVLYLKVNPEIAVIYDNEGLVTGLTARNADAKAILENYTGFEGKETRTVVSELVTAIGDAGYFVEEIDGGRRTITLEIEPGSALPTDKFLDDVVNDVKNAVDSHDWTTPLNLEGITDYGYTNYVDTDYGVGNDGVTDYKDTDYGVNNDGVTDYDHNINNNTDYGEGSDGVTDYDHNVNDSTDYGEGNDGITDYDGTDYNDNTDYGVNADGNTDYNDSDYGVWGDGVTDYNPTDYGSSKKSSSSSKSSSGSSSKSSDKSSSSSSGSTAGKTDYDPTDYGKSDYNEPETDYGKTDYNEPETDYGKTDYNEPETDYGKTDYDATDYGKANQAKA